MKTIKNIILRTLLVAIVLFFALAFFWGASDCSPSMPFPCPEGYEFVD